MARILVVDDEDGVRRAVRRILDSHEVTAVGTWDAAVEALARGAFAMVISDYQLTREGKDGIDLLEEVRRVSPACKRILMSGENPPSTRFQGLVDHFVEKPWDNGELRELVDRLLNLN